MSVLADVIFWSWGIWCWSFLAWQWRGRNRESVLYHFLQETKQAFKVLLVLKIAITNSVYYIIDGGWGMAFYPIVMLCDLLWFLFIKDLGDDDRWKKRRKKAVAKVKEVAGRLVVVPELAPVTGK